jgi:hypothetical protein
VKAELQQDRDVQEWQQHQTSLAFKKQQLQDLKEQQAMLEQSIEEEMAWANCFDLQSSTLLEAATIVQAKLKMLDEKQKEWNVTMDEAKKPAQDFKDHSEQWLCKPPKDIFVEVGLSFTFEAIDGLTRNNLHMLQRAMKLF